MQFLALVVALAATFHVAVAADPAWLVDTLYSDAACATKKTVSYTHYGVCAPGLLSGGYMSLYKDALSYTLKEYDDATIGQCTHESDSNPISLVTACTDSEKQSQVVDPTYGTAYNKIIYKDSASCKARTAANIVSIEAVDSLASTCTGTSILSTQVVSCSGDKVTLRTYSGAPICTDVLLDVTYTSCVDELNTAYQCPSSSDEKAACFAGSETVMLESGTTKLISDVNVGDRILAADMNGVTVFSSVVALAHPKNNIAATFVHIETGSTDIKVTADHLLLASADCIKMQLMKASDIAIGSCLLTVDGAERVEAISTNVGNGIYSVITQEEMIVVNGVVASPFAVNHQAASRYYNIHRAMMTVFPAALGFKLFESLHFGVSAFIGSYV